MAAWTLRRRNPVGGRQFYDAIAFMTPSRPGFELAQGRNAAELDLSRRAVFPPAERAGAG